MQEETASGRQQAKALNPAAAGLEVSKMEGRHQKEEEEKEKAKVGTLPLQCTSLGYILHGVISILVIILVSYHTCTSPSPLLVFSLSVMIVAMQDKKRLKSLFKANAPLAIAKLQEVNDPTTLRKHSILSLPAPQVTDGELEGTYIPCMCGTAVSEERNGVDRRSLDWGCVLVMVIAVC